MNGFQFRAPGTFISEAGCATAAETFANTGHTGRTLLVTDATLLRLGIAAKVQSALEAAGATVVVCGDVEPEPSAATVRRAAEAARTANIERVVGLGGGSPMDVAKLVALLIPCPQPIESMYGVGNATGTRLPLALIPTTAGTGSEATHVAVVTGDDGEKSPVVGPQFICDTVLLDAALTLGLPPDATAATGVDAMVHAIEAYTSAVRKNPVSDQLACKALQLLHGNIRSVMQQGGNVQARGDMLIGSMMAGLAFANATVGAVHALAYPLGTRFHLCHGESNAIVLAPVMRFNLPEATALYAELGRLLLPESAAAPDPDAAEQLIQEMAQLVPKVGLRDRLSQCGIAEEDLDLLAEGTLHQARLLSYNIKPMTRQDILATFRSVL